MAGVSLWARLGFDGKGFEAGMARARLIAKNTNKKIGSEMSAQFKSIGTALLGASFFRWMVNETIKWAQNTKAVREEYEKMGVKLDEDVVKRMVEAGQQFVQLGYEIKVTWLPIIAAIATGIQAITNQLKESIAFWKAFGKQAATNISEAPGTPGAFGGGLGVNRMKGKAPSMSPLDAGALARDEVRRDIVRTMMAAIQAARALLNGPPNTTTTSSSSKSSSLSVRAIEADALAKIGGSVGAPRNRSVEIQQEQLSQLKRIDEHTRRTADAAEKSDIGL